jgi:organic hydroperoxide reductase OsmC/OhrA
MALAHALSEAGYKVMRISTEAKVTLGKDEGGFKINTIELDMEGRVAGIDETSFKKYAEEAKKIALCPGPLLELK